MDKLGHLLAFALPAALAWHLRARWLVWGLLGHALASEFIQDALAPGRAFDPLDTVANVAGAGLGVLLARTLAGVRGHHGNMPTTADRRERS